MTRSARTARKRWEMSHVRLVGGHHSGTDAQHRRKMRRGSIALNSLITALLLSATWVLSLCQPLHRCLLFCCANGSCVLASIAGIRGRKRLLHRQEQVSTASFGCRLSTHHHWQPTIDILTMMCSHSWGARWGEKGYIRMRKGPKYNMCGILDDANYPVV